MARKLGVAELLGPPCPERDLALALVVARVVQPASKLATTRAGNSRERCSSRPVSRTTK